MAPLAAALAIALASPSARAETACEFYKKYLPSLYKINCGFGGGGSGGARQAKSGSGYSSFAQAFNINPANTPTEPTPYGLEVIETSYPAPSGWGLNLGIVKGFKKIGAAVSTGGNATFYGNDVMTRMGGARITPPKGGWESQRGTLTDLNLGTSFEVPSPSGMSTSLGISVRYNKTTNTIGWGAGTATGIGPFSIGLGVSREKISNYLEPVWFLSMVAGVRLGPVQLDHSILATTPITAPGSSLSTMLRPIQIETLSLAYSRVIVALAYRQVQYIRIGDSGQLHFSAQVRLFSHLAVGYMINYIPDTHSFAAQIFL